MPVGEATDVASFRAAGCRLQRSCRGGGAGGRSGSRCFRGPPLAASAPPGDRPRAAGRVSVWRGPPAEAQPPGQRQPEPRRVGSARSPQSCAGRPKRGRGWCLQLCPTRLLMEEGIKFNFVEMIVIRTFGVHTDSSIHCFNVQRSVTA